MGYEIVPSYAPKAVGAVEPTTTGGKVKGWLYAIGLIGVALLAMKYIKPPKRRKNPKRAISARARARQDKLAEARRIRRIQEGGSLDPKGGERQVYDRMAIKRAQQGWKAARRRKARSTRRRKAALKGWRTRRASK